MARLGNPLILTLVAALLPAAPATAEKTADATTACAGIRLAFSPPTGRRMRYEVTNIRGHRFTIVHEAEFVPQGDGYELRMTAIEWSTDAPAAEAAAWRKTVRADDRPERRQRLDHAGKPVGNKPDPDAVALVAFVGDCVKPAPLDTNFPSAPPPPGAPRMNMHSAWVALDDDLAQYRRIGRLDAPLGSGRVYRADYEFDYRISRHWGVLTGSRAIMRTATETVEEIRKFGDFLT